MGLAAFNRRRKIQKEKSGVVEQVDKSAIPKSSESKSAAKEKASKKDESK